MILTVNGRTLSADLADTAAARALADRLRDGDVHVSMAEYGGFEKVGTLPWSLPTSDTRITTQPGDMVLYEGNKLVLFTASNSWSYTRVGRITTISPDELRGLLGAGEVSVTLAAV